MTQLSGNRLKQHLMNKNDIDIPKLREQIRKGLELSFKKLLQQKKAQNGFLILSEDGKIKKIKAVDIQN